MEKVVLSVESPRANEARAFPGIWAFIIADCASFGIFFVAFMAQRLDQVIEFNASSRSLDARYGLINTLILINSSWLVALGVAAARGGGAVLARRFLAAATMVGSLFAVLKVVEYTGEVRRGVTPLTNDFFSYYFALTGVHFFHYCIGMAGLVYLLVQMSRHSAIDPRFMVWIESGGIYWHMVDLLWVFLFPMLYLLGGH